MGCLHKHGTCWTKSSEPVCPGIALPSVVAFLTMAANSLDDLHVLAHATLYDFMLGRGVANAHTPWFIDSASGASWTGAQIKRRTDVLALGLHSHLSLGLNDYPSSSSRGDVREVVSLISPNDIDFGVCVWAAHRLGCTVAPSNAISTAEELTHQLRLSGARTIIVHPTAADRALAAARACGIPQKSVILLSRDHADSNLTSTETLIHLGELLTGKGQTIILPSSRLSPPAQLRVAFLCFSSGTTGLPKAVLIPHRAVIANVLQVSAAAIPRSRTMAGQDRALGVVPFSHMYGLLHLVHLCPLLGIASVAYQSLPHPFPAFLDSLEEHRINHLFLAPPLVSAFVKHPACAGRDFSRYFKTAMVAAAPLDAATEETFRRLCGPQFVISQVRGCCLPMLS
jgi:4-coumarate--CoA ligase